MPLAWSPIRWVAAAGFLGIVSVHGQSIESLAGQTAADSMKGSDINQPYNLEIGPVTLRTDASITGTYNDNINVAHSGRLADFIIEPDFDIHGRWQATDLNALELTVGAGYQYYLDHTSASGIVLSPDSNLQFNVFIGDVRVNLHDDFSYSEDPIDVGQVNNVTQFARFQNDAGINADWDLGDIIVSLGYDHTNLWVFQSQFSYLDYNDDILTPKITIKISPSINAGIVGSLSYMRFDQNIENNNFSGALGPFVTAVITNNISVSAQFGWYLAYYEKGGLNGDSENINSYYGSLSVNHRFNDVISDTFTAGREYIPGITSNFTQRTYAQYNINWAATQFISFGAQIWWENLDDSEATFREDADRFGAGLSANYSITDHVSLSLGYQYVLKTSSSDSLSYYQDAVDFSVRYSF